MSSHRAPRSRITGGTASSTVTRRGPANVSNTNAEKLAKAALRSPSTQRALLLRNGAGGTFGSGEMIRMSGREKLELLAHDEMAKAKKGRSVYNATAAEGIVKAPFKLETALRVAQSQMDAYIDVVNALHVPEQAYDYLKNEIKAHVPAKMSPDAAHPMETPAFVAEQFGISVHNVHMLASAWLLIYESLWMLKKEGLFDLQVYAQLKDNPDLREIYFTIYELLKKLVDVGQQRLRTIVSNTEHYSKFFKIHEGPKGYMEFAGLEVRNMCKSFLDSTVIELCLPKSNFSPAALYACLHAVETENPKELKRCPQAMWDAVGDLAETVRLMEMLEDPLLNKPAINSYASYIYVREWEETQATSIKAAVQYSGYVNLVCPLQNLKSKVTLDKTWDRLNANYVRESGENIDDLWKLTQARERKPYFVPVKSTNALPFDFDSSLNAVVRKDAKPEAPKPSKNARALKAGADDGEDSDTSIPSLISGTDSEVDADYDNWDEDSEVSSFYSSDDESDDPYDLEEEEELRRFERDAMNKLSERPNIVTDDRYVEERKSNPFLNLLGNLKGRLFPAATALRSDGKQPTSGKSKKKGKGGGGAAQPTQPVQETKPTTAVEEEADDENDTQAAKKKKKKNKKKRAAGEAESEITSPISPTSPGSTIQSPISTTASKSSAAKTTPQKRQSASVSSDTLVGSTTQLPLPTEQKAESARKYLSTIPKAKEKVKKRPEQESQSMLSGFKRMIIGDTDKVNEEGNPKKETTTASIFGDLPMKVNTRVRRLFGISAQERKGTLKWDQFVDIMTKVGFTYVPSTAGSSVRFDHPDPNVRSFMIHKPHPDPTLHEFQLRDIRDKLRKYYDWTPDKLRKVLNGEEYESDEGDDDSFGK